MRRHRPCRRGWRGGCRRGWRRRGPGFRAERLLDRPSRRAAPVPRAHQRILRGGGAHGGRHRRVRRGLHQGSRAGLPARPVRPAHHHQHPGRTGAGGQVHRAVHAGRSRCRPGGVGEVLHERPDARRVPHARGQDGRLRSGCGHGRGLHGRDGALAHRPVRAGHADDPCREHRAVQESGQRNSRPSSRRPRSRCRSRATTPRRTTPSS